MQNCSQLRSRLFNPWRQALGLVLLLLMLVLTSTVSLGQKKSLRIYVYESLIGEYGVATQWKKDFEASCGCGIDFISFSDAHLMLNRLILEGKANKADLVLGLDNSLLDKALNSGLFQPHQVTAATDLLPIAKNAVQPYFYPFDYGWLAVMFHQGQARPPKSLTELTDYGTKPKYFILEDPRSSSPGLGFVYWVEKMLKADTAKFWQALAPKILATPQGWSEAYQMFLNNKDSLVVSYVSSPLYHEIAEQRTDIQALSLKEGAFLQVEYVGIVKNTSSLALAQDFVRFITSPKAQSLVAEGQWMFPVVKVPLDARFTKVHQAYEKFSQVLFPKEAELKASIKAWQAAIAR